MTTTAVTQIPTTVLPATLVEVPATVTYELKNYSRDEDGGREGPVEHVELHRNGKLVAKIYNHGNGGMPDINIQVGGEAFGQERKVLHGWIADFKAAGLKYRIDGSAFGKEDLIVEYDEEAVANTLLYEAYVTAVLSSERKPVFTESQETARRGEHYNLKGGSTLTDGQIRDYVNAHEGVMVWSKTEQKWLDTLS